MERFIFDISQAIIEIYKVTDEYIIRCNNLPLKKSKGLIFHIEESAYYQIRLDTTLDIFNQKEISHHKTLMTDGHWIWSADLNYYTMYHNFIWPKNFIEYIKSGEKTIVTDEILDQIENDYHSTLFSISEGIYDKNEKLIEYRFVDIE